MKFETTVLMFEKLAIFWTCTINDKFGEVFKASLKKACLTSLEGSGQNIVPLVSVGKKGGAGMKTRYCTNGTNR